VSDRVRTRIFGKSTTKPGQPAEIAQHS
jgi:hypothetical protein